MLINNNKAIPERVKNFLLTYEKDLKLDKGMQDEIELTVVTDTDIFEGILRYWKDRRSILEVVTWNGNYYNELPKIFKLVKKEE